MRPGKRVQGRAGAIVRLGLPVTFSEAFQRSKVDFEDKLADFSRIWSFCGIGFCCTSSTIPSESVIFGLFVKSRKMSLADHILQVSVFCCRFET